MKTVLKVLKAIFVSPVVWLATKLKALFLMEEPVLKRAAANLPGETRSLLDFVKSLVAGFRAAWKAVNGWTWVMRVATCIALCGALLATGVVGHRLGHRKVPGLQAQVLKQGNAIASKDLKIAQLTADLAKAKTDLDNAKKIAPGPAPAPAVKSNHRTARKAVKKTADAFSFSSIFN